MKFYNCLNKQNKKFVLMKSSISIDAALYCDAYNSNCDVVNKNFSNSLPAFYRYWSQSKTLNNTTLNKICEKIK